MSNDRIFELVKKAEGVLGLSVGPAVMKKTGKGEIKVSYNGRPIMTIVLGQGGIEKVSGLGTLREVIVRKLVEDGAGIDLEVNPNHAKVVIWDYEEPSRKVVSRKGASSESSALVLEAFCDYYGVL